MISAISNSFEILNVLTTIHSFSSRQWISQRQCVYELSNWHNTQLIYVWSALETLEWPSQVWGSLIYYYSCQEQLSPFVFNDIWELSHDFSCLFMHLYINQCKFHMFISHQDHHPLVQHVLLRTPVPSTYEINSNECTYIHLWLFHSNVSNIQHKWYS